MAKCLLDYVAIVLGDGYKSNKIPMHMLYFHEL
jgi:hypothetical protein